MTRLNVRHLTTYRYANPVRLGDHRLMIRPRDSHDLRLIDATLAITPQPTVIRWLHDVQGNSVAIASFDCMATELRFESNVQLDHFMAAAPNYALDDAARTYPFAYLDTELPDLIGSMTRRHNGPEIAEWAHQFLGAENGFDTLEMLRTMTLGIREQFTYAARDEMGVQTPVETLQLRSGTCRDFAFLMMEAVRSLGLAARFVSGYIYSPALDGGHVGGGATHAWVQVYLPGSGWLEYDPTNGIIGNRDLIRVAVARDPSQAQPLSGTWTGAAGDYLGMEVNVAVTSGEQPAP